MNVDDHLKDCPHGIRKNQYIRKINSLLQLSEETLPYIPKQKPIQKQRSKVSSSGKKTIKEKNREAAKKARQRKKIYLDLLEKTISNLQGLAKKAQNVENETKNFLNSLLVEDIQVESELSQIGIFFQNEQKQHRNEENFEHQRDPSFELISEIISISLPHLLLSLQPQTQLQTQIQKVTNTMHNQFSQLLSIQKQLNDVMKNPYADEYDPDKISKKEELMKKVVQQMGYGEYFKGKEGKNFNIYEYELLQAKMKKVTDLNI